MRLPSNHVRTIAAAKRGNVRARSRLIRDNVGLIGEISRWYSHDEPQQFYADGAMGIVKAIETFEPERGTAFVTHAWWRVIGKVSVAARKERVQRGRWPLFVDHPEHLTRKAKTETLDHDTIQTVRNAVDALPERERCIVAMRMEGRTLEGVGRVLNLSKERVRQIQERAYGTLRAQLREAV